METSKIKFGLSEHFPRHHWLNNSKYIGMCVTEMQYNLKLHAQTTQTAFQNILAFLKSIELNDRDDSEDMYETILESDPYNLNALVGLHEITKSPKQRTKCKETVDKILRSDKYLRAVPKALLEIGLSLCLLIPKYHFDDIATMGPEEAYQLLNLDSYPNLEFTTEDLPMDLHLYTDTHIAKKKRAHSSIRYLNEGLKRLSEGNIDGDNSDKKIWNFFLAMAYNRLDNWISYTHGSSKLRKKVSLKSLRLFCDIAFTTDPNCGDKHSKMYFQRCLAYIGQILSARKSVVMQGEDGDYVPECFRNYKDHIIYSLWDDPKKAFRLALDYGYDKVVYIRHAKTLLFDAKYDEIIKIITDTFDKDDSVLWYAASVRMKALRLKHAVCYKDAKRNGDFSTLTKDVLLKAEADGRYCFEANAQARDMSQYAGILRWLGTFPDGESVTDGKKIRSALNVLDRVYMEEGCHTHYRVHKIRAECHRDLGDINEAIKYAIWALSTSPDTDETPPICFSLLIGLLFEKHKHDITIGDCEKRNILQQVRYYIETEINRCCHQFIPTNFAHLKDGPLAKVHQLLQEEYNKEILDEVKDFVSTKMDSDSPDRQHILQLCKKYDVIFGIMRKWCQSYPDQIKDLLDLTADMTSNFPLPTFAIMCLICLGGQHKRWTQDFNRQRKTKHKDVKELDLFSPGNLGATENRSQFDFLVIHAPEDKYWVFYTLLPEMEQRPTEFKGCIPDRDFKKSDTFEQNIENVLGKTRKVLLVISSNFLQRVYALLEKTKLLKKLWDLHNNRTVDVITIFSEATQLDVETHFQLMKFDNVATSRYRFDWNYLRVLLLRDMPPLDTTREAVRWEGTGDERHVEPHDNENERYKALEEEILPYGVPEAVFIKHKMSYIIGYNGERRIPRWTAHKIDSNDKRGNVNRQKYHKQLRSFRQDETVPKQARSSGKDFENRPDMGKGHMVPLADKSSTLELARDTNILTNIVPEVKNNFLWNRLEEYCRDELTKDFETIYVMSGTLFLPEDEQTENKTKEEASPTADVSSTASVDACAEQLQQIHIPCKKEKGRKFVKYEVIGRNEVAVPTHFFKVIIAKTSNNKRESGAFIVPNKPLYDAELSEMSVPISYVEKRLGINLFKNLEQDIKDANDTTLTCTTPFFPKEYRAKKIVRYVDNLPDLNVIWEVLASDVQEKLQSEYDKKKSHLEKKRNEDKEDRG